MDETRATKLGEAGHLHEKTACRHRLPVSGSFSSSGSPRNDSVPQTRAPRTTQAMLPLRKTAHIGFDNANKHICKLKNGVPRKSPLSLSRPTAQNFGWQERVAGAGRRCTRASLHCLHLIKQRINIIFSEFQRHARPQPARALQHRPAKNPPLSVGRNAGDAHSTSRSGGRFSITLRICVQRYSSYVIRLSAVSTHQGETLARPDGTSSERAHTRKWHQNICLSQLYNIQFIIDPCRLVCAPWLRYPEFLPFFILGSVL